MALSGNKKIIFLFLFFFSTSLAYVNYSQYYVDSKFGQLEDFHREIINGKGFAPFQYRILIHYVVEKIFILFPSLTYRRIFGLVDAIFLYLIVICCYYFWEKEKFRQAKNCFNVIPPFLTSLYFFLWNNVFHSVYTVFSILYVVLTCLLISKSAQKPDLYFYTFLIILSILQSFNRAEIPFVLGLGFLISGYMHKNNFNIHIGIFFCCLIFVPLLIQFLLSFYIFPDALWHEAGFLQIFKNFGLKRMVPFFSFIFPFALSASYCLKNTDIPPIHYSLIISSLIYIIIWFIFGKIDEPRIFFPFCIPLSTIVVYTFANCFKEKES
jgi:hypothetical protein